MHEILIFLSTFFSKQEMWTRVVFDFHPFNYAIAGHGKFTFVDIYRARAFNVYYLHCVPLL